MLWTTVLIINWSGLAIAETLSCGHLIDSNYVQANCQENNVHNECGRPISPGVHFAPWFAVEVHQDLSVVEESVAVIDGLANTFRFHSEGAQVRALEFTGRQLILDMVFLSGQNNRQIGLSMVLYKAHNGHPGEEVYRGQADILLNYEQFAELRSQALRRYIHLNPQHQDIYTWDFACVLELGEERALTLQ